MNEKIICEVCKKELYSAYILEQLDNSAKCYCAECYYNIVNKLNKEELK